MSKTNPIPNLTDVLSFGFNFIPIVDTSGCFKSIFSRYFRMYFPIFPDVFPDISGCISRYFRMYFPIFPDVFPDVFYLSGTVYITNIQDVEAEKKDQASVKKRYSSREIHSDLRKG